MNPCQICFSIFFAIVLIISIILFSLSFSIVDLNTIALKRNTYNRKVEQKQIYKPGRYMAGLTGEFIAYDSTWQYINFSNDDGADSTQIIVKTKQEESVSVEIGIVFKLKQEQLAKLYAQYPSQNHKKDMINSAKSVIQAYNPSSYTDFFTRRHEITNNMSLQVNKKFKNDFFSEITLFLLKEVILDTVFEDKIISQLVKEQEIKTQIKLNEIKAQEGTLSVIESETQQQVDEIINSAKSNADTIRSQNIAKGDGEVLDAEAKGYSKFKDAAIIGDPWETPEIVEFMNWQKFISSQNVNLFMGVTDNARVEI